MHFTAQVDSKTGTPSIEYQRTVTFQGKIIKGQGTPEIDVLPALSGITATVELTGLPTNCENTASESLEWLENPRAVRVDEFIGPLPKISAGRFADIVKMVLSNRSAQLLVVISGTQENSAASIKKKRQFILDQIARKMGEDGGMRITYVDSDMGDDRVVIWLVPPGAEAPPFPKKPTP
jgi:hypothetical protein